MHDIQLKLNENGRGTFFIEEDGERLAEMEVAIVKENLTVFHTEVNDKLRGQGIASQLLAAMVDYSRRNNKKVIPLCPYEALSSNCILNSILTSGIRTGINK